MNMEQVKPQSRQVSTDSLSKWKFCVADRLVVQRLLPVMDGNSLKMLFFFDVVQKSTRVRYWYLSDVEIAIGTGMRFEHVAKARRKLADLALIDYRMCSSGALYRWHRISKMDKRRNHQAS